MQLLVDESYGTSGIEMNGSASFLHSNKSLGNRQAVVTTSNKPNLKKAQLRDRLHRGSDSLIHSEEYSYESSSKPLYTEWSTIVPKLQRYATGIPRMIQPSLISAATALTSSHRASGSVAPSNIMPNFGNITVNKVSDFKRSEASKDTSRAGQCVKDAIDRHKIPKSNRDTLAKKAPEGLFLEPSNMKLSNGHDSLHDSETFNRLAACHTNGEVGSCTRQDPSQLQTYEIVEDGWKMSTLMDTQKSQGGPSPTSAADVKVIPMQERTYETRSSPRCTVAVAPLSVSDLEEAQETESIHDTRDLDEKRDGSCHANVREGKCAPEDGSCVDKSTPSPLKPERAGGTCFRVESAIGTDMQSNCFGEVSIAKGLIPDTEHASSLFSCTLATEHSVMENVNNNKSLSPLVTRSLAPKVPSDPEIVTHPTATYFPEAYSGNDTNVEKEENWTSSSVEAVQTMSNPTTLSSARPYRSIVTEGRAFQESPVVNSPAPPPTTTTPTPTPTPTLLTDIYKISNPANISQSSNNIVTLELQTPAQKGLYVSPHGSVLCSKQPLLVVPPSESISLSNVRSASKLPENSTGLPKKRMEKLVQYVEM